MSYDDDHEEYALQAAVEGNGYHKSKGLQWLDLCPHLGTSEKTLLRVLLSLTRQENPRRKLAPEELRHLVYAGPVPLGETPKYASVSGLRRMLRTLATMGQITTPEDTPLTFSSGKSAQKRAVTMQIWRYPRHECGSRNAFDALARHRGEKGEKGPRYPLAGPDMSPRWQHLPTLDTDTPSDQLGQKDDQLGQKDDQLGQKDDQLGQKDDQHSGDDQGEGALPCTAPSTAPSTPPSPPAPQLAEEAEEVPAEPFRPSGREDEILNDDSNDSAPLAEALEIVKAAVRLWPKSHKAPSANDLHRLAERVQAELATGGEERYIIHELSRDMNDMGGAMRVMMGSRTKIPGWGRNPDPRPDHSQHEITVKHPWCGQCSEGTRMVHVIVDEATGDTRPARCRQPVVDTGGATVACHPMATLPMAFTEEPAEMSEIDVPAAIAASLEEAAEQARQKAQYELAAVRAKLADISSGAEREEKARAGSRR